MYRTLVIFRHTFREVVSQPIFILLLLIAGAFVGLFKFLPFFTFGEDTLMYKSVCLDMIMLLVLLATLFATSRSIFDEIEDRTMLTLMSKPVSRMEVLVGKYLGIVGAALLAVALLGILLAVCVWSRIPYDYSIRSQSETRQVFEMRWMHMMGLIPSLILLWLQISVLAAIGVSLSTRFSLVVNLPVVILLYIAGSLMRFLFPLSADGAPLQHAPAVVQGLAYLVSNMLPYLRTFDLRESTVYATIALPGTRFVEEYGAVALSQIWKYVGIAFLNAVFYASFVLGIGMLMFSRRELGGAEG